MRLANRGLNRAMDILFLPPIHRLWMRRLRGLITCLLYHRVDDPQTHAFLTRGGSPVTTPEEFESDLRFLKQSPTRFFTLRQIAEGDGPGPGEVGIAICFDDCFRSDYRNAIPILEELKIFATFLQTTSLVDGEDLLWEHKLYWYTRDDAVARRFQSLAASVLRQPDIQRMSTKQLIMFLRQGVPFWDCAKALDEMVRLEGDDAARGQTASAIYPCSEDLVAAAALGHDIGSHGHNHYFRANVSAEVFERDLRVSVDTLSSILGRAPSAFSFPFDSRTPGDAETCSRYFQLVATCDVRPFAPGDDLMSFPRCSWPGSAKNIMRQRRWLVTGRI